MRRRKVEPSAGPGRTFDFLFLQGTQALEMQRRLVESSPEASLFPLRPFLAGASGRAWASSMAATWRAPEVEEVRSGRGI